METIRDNQDGSIILELFKALIAFAVVGIAVACYLDPPRILEPVGNFLVHSESPENGDAIVILLGGDPGRIAAGFNLFQKNLSPRIVFGSGYIHREAFASLPPHFKWPSPSEPYIKALESLGLASERIELVDTSNNVDTSGELSAIADTARRKGWRSVILVSSAPHSKRVKLIWNRVAPDIRATVVAARPEDMDKWWTREPMVRAVGYEYGALVKEFVRRIIILARSFR